MTAKMKQEVANIRAAAKRHSEYEQTLEAIRMVVNRCADVAITQMRGLACQGLACNAELYFGKCVNGEKGLFLVPEVCSSADPTWTATGRILKCNVPYNQYEKWIADNSRDLDIL